MPIAHATWIFGDSFHVSAITKQIIKITQSNEYGFSVSSAHSWNPDYDYDYREEYSGWPPIQNPNFPFMQPPPFNRFAGPALAMPPSPPRCNCIKMRDCPPLMTKLVTASLPLPMNLIKDLRKTSCGYAGIEPLVCCPSQVDAFGFSRDVTTEKPWIWDVIDKRAAEPSEPSKAQWRPNKHTKYYGPKQSKKKHHFFEFEDPRTFRNCPPSFSPDFNMPHRFHNTAPVRNFNPLRINVEGMSPSDISSIKGANEDIEPNLIFSNSNDIGSTAIVFPTVSSIPAHKAHLVNSKSCGISINSRIIGGEDAGPGQFPWYVQPVIRSDYKLFAILCFVCFQDGPASVSQSM